MKPFFADWAIPEIAPNAPTFASLFTGGGLAAMGAALAGCKVIWGVEFNPKKPKLSSAIADAYQLNFPSSHLIRQTVQDVVNSGLIYTLFSPDILQISPPCTNVSQANKGGMETTEDIEIAIAVCKAIEILLSPVILLENVRQYQGKWAKLRDPETGRLHRRFVKTQSWEMIEAKLLELGYQVQTSVLNAADYGVPQSRERFIAVAVRGVPLPNWPTKCEQMMGWYDAIADIADELPETELAPWQAERLPEWIKGSPDNTLVDLRTLSGSNQSRTFVAREQAQPSNCITATHLRRPVTTPIVLLNNGGDSSARRYREKEEPAHTIRASASPHKAILIENTGAFESLKTRQADEPAWTIKASTFTDQKGHARNKALMAWSGTKIVRLIPRAIARLMSVPDCYLLPDSPAIAGPLLGNGIPVVFAKALFSEVLIAMAKTKTPTVEPIPSLFEVSASSPSLSTGNQMIGKDGGKDSTKKVAKNWVSELINVSAESIEFYDALDNASPTELAKALKKILENPWGQQARREAVTQKLLAAGALASQPTELEERILEACNSPDYLSTQQISQALGLPLEEVDQGLHHLHILNLVESHPEYGDEWISRSAMEVREIAEVMGEPTEENSPSEMGEEAENPNDNDSTTKKEEERRKEAEGEEIAKEKVFVEYATSPRDELHQLEERVKGAFYIAGCALREIRDRELWKQAEIEFMDFAHYCRETFGHGSRRQGDLIIAATEVYENLQVSGCSVLPDNERQVRLLSKFDPEEQTVIWEKAVTDNSGKLPSGRKVEDAAIALGKIPPREPKEKDPLDLKLTVEQLSRFLKFPHEEGETPDQLRQRYEHHVTTEALLGQNSNLRLSVEQEIKAEYQSQIQQWKVRHERERDRTAALERELALIKGSEDELANQLAQAKAELDVLQRRLDPASSFPKGAIDFTERRQRKVGC